MTSVTYSYFIPFSSASIVDFEQVNVTGRGINMDKMNTIISFGKSKQFVRTSIHLSAKAELYH